MKLLQVELFALEIDPSGETDSDVLLFSIEPDTMKRQEED